jgi:hypothetical protein
MNRKETGWGDMDWIDLAQNRDWWRALVNTVMSIRSPQNVEKFLSSCETGGFSRRGQLHEVNYPNTQSMSDCTLYRPQRS